MRETTASDIERYNTIILLVGSLASILIMRDYKYFFSFAAASAVVTLNFRFLRKIMEGFFSGSVQDKKELLIKLPLKFVLMVAAIVVIIVWGDVNIPFFLIGLSTVFVSLLITQVVNAFISHSRENHDGA
jgi:hypothetical protein